MKMIENDMKTLKLLRGTSERQITRSLHILGTKISSAHDAPGRLILAEETWQKFSLLHENILKQMDDEEETEKEEVYRHGVEDAYVSLRALLHPFITITQSTEVSKTVTENTGINVPNVTFTLYSENETFSNFLMR